MRHLSRLLIVALFIIISPLTLPAVTRYVNNDTGCAGCSDSCNATTAQTVTTACDTVNKCVSLMASGDTCSLRTVGNGGVYVEAINDTTQNCATCVLIPSGTSRAAATRITGYPGDPMPTLKPTASGAGGAIRHTKTDVPRQFIIYDGLKIDVANGGSGPTSNYMGIFIQAGSSIDFQNGEVTNSNLTTPAPISAIQITNINPPNGNPDPTDIRLINNYVHDIGSPDPASSAQGYGIYVSTSGNIVEKNVIANISGGCLQVYAASNTGPPRRQPSNNIIRQNSCTNNARFGSTGDAAMLIGNDNNLVMNNLFYNVKRTAISVIYGVTPTGNKVYNNTICNVISAGGASNGIKINADQTNTDIKNNVVHLATTPFSNSGVGTINTTNWFNPSQGNPLFINACNNLHLQTSSPLINAGTNLSGTSTVDYAGNARDATWDIGAHAYGMVTPLHLEFTTEPSNTVVGVLVAPLVTVCIYDTTQTLQTANVTAISLAITSNPASGTLTGGAGGAATNGCRTFPISVNNAGTPYVVTASAAGIIDIASQPFAITAVVSESSLRSLNMMYRP